MISDSTSEYDLLVTIVTKAIFSSHNDRSSWIMFGTYESTIGNLSKHQSRWLNFSSSSIVLVKSYRITTFEPIIKDYPFICKITGWVSYHFQYRKYYPSKVRWLYGGIILISFQKFTLKVQITLSLVKHFTI